MKKILWEDYEGSFLLDPEDTKEKVTYGEETVFYIVGIDVKEAERLDKIIKEKIENDEDFNHYDIDDIESFLKELGFDEVHVSEMDEFEDPIKE